MSLATQLKNKQTKQSQRDSITDKALVLHTTNPVLIPDSSLGVEVIAQGAGVQALHVQDSDCIPKLL